jgi:hypothetical protein
MQDLTDDERRHILGEVMMDELKAIREGISFLPTRSEFKRLEEKVDGLSDDMKAVKAVVKSHSHEFDNHEHRLKLLEQGT